MEQFPHCLHPTLEDSERLFACCLLVGAAVKGAAVKGALGNPTRAASILCSQKRSGAHLSVLPHHCHPYRENGTSWVDSAPSAKMACGTSGTCELSKMSDSMQKHDASGYWELDGVWAHLTQSNMSAVACAGTFLHTHRSGIVHSCCYSHICVYRHDNGLTIRSIYHKERCMDKSTWKKQTCYGTMRVGDFVSECIRVHMCACKYIYLCPCVCLYIWLIYAVVFL